MAMTANSYSIAQQLIFLHASHKTAAFKLNMKLNMQILYMYLYLCIYSGFIVIAIAKKKRTRHRYELK